MSIDKLKLEQTHELEYLLNEFSNAAFRCGECPESAAFDYHINNS